MVYRVLETQKCSYVFFECVKTFQNVELAPVLRCEYIVSLNNALYSILCSYNNSQWPAVVYWVLKTQKCSNVFFECVKTFQRVELAPVLRCEYIVSLNNALHSILCSYNNNQWPAVVNWVLETQKCSYVFFECVKTFQSVELAPVLRCEYIVSLNNALYSILCLYNNSQWPAVVYWVLETQKCSNVFFECVKTFQNVELVPVLQCEYIVSLNNALYSILCSYSNSQCPAVVYWVLET